MERLHKLLHAINPQQVKVLKNYLTGFSTRDSNTKFWELCHFLLSQKNPSSISDCSYILYNSQKDSRIVRLKNRLYAKVLDSLLIDINTSRDIYEDETHSIQIRLRKKMILYDLLKFTPLKTTVCFEMIDDIIQTSKKYEFYSILLEALYIYKGNNGMRKGIKIFRETTREIEFYEKCKLYSQRALDIATELSMYSTFNTKADKSKLEKYLQRSIEEMKAYFIETNSKIVGYHLKTFEMTLLHLEGKIKEAREVVLDMLNFMKKNKTVGRKGRFGMWYIYLADCDINLGEYDDALQHLYIARKYFSENQLNLAINKKLEADTFFLKGDYKHTMEIADELVNSNTKVTGDFRRDIMLFYIGCCHFMLGEFRQAARMFSLKFELTQDKLGWEINIRFN